MKLKLKRAAAFASAMIIAMGAKADTSVTVKYQSDGIDTKVPYPGELRTVIDGAEGTAEGSGIRLINAVYNLYSGNTLQTAMSEKGGALESTMTIDTMNGKLFKNFVWSSEMRPVIQPIEERLILFGEYRYKTVFLKWKRTAEIDADSFRIMRNSEIIAENLPVKQFAFTDSEPLAVTAGYMICAMKNGREVARSNVQHVAPGNGVHIFDAANVVVNKTDDSVGYRVSSPNDDSMQILGNGENLDISTNIGIGSDNGWCFAEIGGRTAMYTGRYYTSADKTATKNGNIYVDLGSSFKTSDRAVKLTIEYYDPGSGYFNVRYVSGKNDSGTGTHSVIPINYSSSGWKTAEIVLNGAFFNGVSNTNLFTVADFRFESKNTAPVYIGSLTIDNSFDGYGEFVAAADNVLIEHTESGGVIRTGGKYVSLMGYDSLRKETAGGADYQLDVTSDTVYMFVEEIDGKSAVMSANLRRPNNTVRKGQLSFALDSDAFTPEDGCLLVEMEYNSNYASPTLEYICSAELDGGSTVWKSDSAKPRISGSGTWKTASFYIENAVFNKELNGKFSNYFTGEPVFRVPCSSPVYIHSVKVYLESSVKSAESEKLYPGGGQLSFENGVQNGKGIRLDDSQKDSLLRTDNAMTYVTCSGSMAASTQSFLNENNNRKTFLYFDADDEFMWGLKDNYCRIEVTYLDNSIGAMTLEYRKKGGFGKSVINQTNTGEWKTSAWNIYDACFLNGLNNNTDFRLSLDTTAEERKQLIVKSIRITGASQADEDTLTEAPVIYLAGDSTCEIYPENYYPREGWGMEIGKFFDDGVTFINKAKGGKSTRSFLNNMDITSGGSVPDTRWSDILAQGKYGDYLFIQFGHNDRGAAGRMTDPDSLQKDETSYRYNLKRFIIAAKEKGMIPVLLTSVWERKFDDDGKMSDTTIEPYRTAMREIGGIYDVPVIDVGAEHKKLAERWGVEDSKKLYIHISLEDYPDFPTKYASLNDDTHLSATGAAEVCKIIIHEIKEKAASYPQLEELSKFINPSANINYIK